MDQQIVPIQVQSCVGVGLTSQNVSLECHLQSQEGSMGGGTESFVNVEILHAARHSKRNWRKTIWI